MAAVFNPWTLLFLILVVLSLVYYSGNDIKTSVIPVLGVLCVLSLKVCYNIIIFDSYLIESDYSFNVILDFSNYLNVESTVTFTTLGLLIIWSLVKLLVGIGERNTQDKPHAVLGLEPGVAREPCSGLGGEEHGRRGRTGPAKTEGDCIVEAIHAALIENARIHVPTPKKMTTIGEKPIMDQWARKLVIKGSLSFRSQTGTKKKLGRSMRRSKNTFETCGFLRTANIARGVACAMSTLNALRISKGNNT